MDLFRVMDQIIGLYVIYMLMDVIFMIYMVMDVIYMVMDMISHVYIDGM